MECPRCRQPLSELELRGGPYRGSGAREDLLRCERCKVTFMSLGRLGGAIPKQAGYVSVERSRRPTTEGCPVCLASFERVYVEYRRVAVEYEECPKCKVLALDDGEINALRSIREAVREQAEAPSLEEDPPRVSAADELLDELGALYDRIEEALQS